MKMSVVALSGLVVVSSSAAFTQSLTSTYMETQSCRTIEEGDDRFTLRCNAPAGNVSAILSYWDGRAFVVYEPFFTRKIVKAHMRNISNIATRAFGQKLEWRLRAGEKLPCAAIIRVYNTKGGTLVVNDMATGRHLGDAKTNEQARKLADRACLSKQKDKIVANRVEERLPETAPDTVTETKIDVPKVGTTEQAIRHAERKFKAVYSESGILGAVDEIKTCYKNLSVNAELSELAYCAALDIIAGNVDTMISQGDPAMTQNYFGRGLETDKRIESEFARLQISSQQRTQFDKEISIALQIKLNDSVETTENNHSDNESNQGKNDNENTNFNQQKSVFDFD